MNSQELVNYLETLRYRRNINQDAFLDEVVSIRQYHRYRNGEAEITFSKIEAFAGKLGIPTKKLLDGFEREKTNQDKIVNDFYNAIVRRETDKVIKLDREIKDLFIIDAENKMYYQFAKIVNDFYNNKIDGDTLVELISKLIDYPNVLRKTVFSDIETLIMSTILNHLKNEEKQVLLEHFKKMYTGETTILGGDKSVVNMVIIQCIIRTIGVDGDYQSVLDLTQKVIKESLELKRYYMLDYMYYYQALAAKSLKKESMFNHALIQCYLVLSLDASTKTMEKYTKVVKKDFDIDFKEYVLNKLSE